MLLVILFSLDQARKGVSLPLKRLLRFTFVLGRGLAGRTLGVIRLVAIRAPLVLQRGGAVSPLHAASPLGRAAVLPPRTD